MFQKNITYISLLVMAVLLAVLNVNDPAEAGQAPMPNESRKKVLYINSYDLSFDWSRGVLKGTTDKFNVHMDTDFNLDDSDSPVQFKLFNMDTKNNHSETYKKEIALKAKSLIESWQPDVVICADDNASKYLIAPYFKDSEIPFVFCGVNWDASVYGLPYTNVTGMVEVFPIQEALMILKPHLKGNRIGFLAHDTLTERKNAKYFKEIFNLDLTSRFVTNMEQLEREFIVLQQQCDLVFITDVVTLKDHDPERYLSITKHYTVVPTVGFPGTGDNALNYLLNCSRLSKEQGAWAADAALQIINGKAPSEIPLAMNHMAKVRLNIALMKKLGIKFPAELMERVGFVWEKEPKILWVDSYHAGYRWSEDLGKGVMRALNISVSEDGSYELSESGVKFQVFRMDTKLNTSESFKKTSAQKAKEFIDQWQPDLIIASDDNAAKYLIAPYYRNASIPVIFCGINWDAEEYGFPADNITGMVEVDPLLETIALLKEYAKGERIGYLGANNISTRKRIPFNRQQMGKPYSEGILVDDFEQWKAGFLKLQEETDMLILFTQVGISGWNFDEAEKFIQANAKIPIGTMVKGNVRLSMLGQIKIGEEQGWWAGRTAISVLTGTEPAEIPVARNQSSKLYLNPKLAYNIGIRFPVELIEQAMVVQ